MTGEDEDGGRWVTVVWPRRVFVPSFAPALGSELVIDGGYTAQ